MLARITTSSGRVLGSAIGSGSSTKIRIVRNRVMNSWRLLNRSAGRFWIILRTRSLNSGVTSLLCVVSGERPFVQMLLRAVLAMNSRGMAAGHTPIHNR